MATLIFYSTVSPDRDDEAWGAFSLARRAVLREVAAGAQLIPFIA